MTAGSPIVDALIHKAWCSEQEPCLACIAERNARIAAALALHYPAYSDADRTPLCPDCKGAEGTHPCGCWGPAGGVRPVCGHCHTGGYRSGSVPWPCPTATALGAVLPW